MTHRGSVSIDQPLDVVFDFLADARNEPRWLPGAASVRLTSAEPIGGGSNFVGEYARAGTVTLRLERCERPHRITIAGDGKMLSFADDIQLRPTDSGTLLSATMTTEPKGVFRLLAPMMSRAIGKQFQANWDSLKRALEGTATQA